MGRICKLFWHALPPPVASTTRPGRHAHGAGNAFEADRPPARTPVALGNLVDNDLDAAPGCRIVPGADRIENSCGDPGMNFAFVGGKRTVQSATRFMAPPSGMPRP